MTREELSSIKLDISKRNEEIGKAAFSYHCKQQSLHPNWRGDRATVFADGALWADAHPHWISVEEQLPPKEAWRDEFIANMSFDVLATDGKTVHICFYDYNLERWLYGDFWQLDNITHWMPLPSVEHLKKGDKK